MKIEEIYLPNRIHSLEDLENIQPIKGVIQLNSKEFRAFMRLIKPSYKRSPHLSKEMSDEVIAKMRANYKKWMREGKGVYYRGIPVVRN